MRKRSLLASLRLAVVLVLFLVAAAPARAFVGLAPGSGSFEFRDEGNADRPLTVYYHLPAGDAARMPIVFVMHGVYRNGGYYCKSWTGLSDSYRFILVCPEFSERFYPNGLRYSEGFMFDHAMDDAGHPISVDALHANLRPRERWDFAAIEHLFDRVKALTGNGSAAYYLYGHSAGGQFVQRFVLFMPDARYARAVAAEPGWYTMPIGRGDYADLEPRFPYGMLGTRINKPELRGPFGREVVFLVGERDVDRNDENLYKTPAADAEGPERLSRARRFIRVCSEVARNMGYALAWRLVTVPGVAHDNTRLAPIAARLFFGR